MKSNRSKSKIQDEDSVLVHAMCPKAAVLVVSCYNGLPARLIPPDRIAFDMVAPERALLQCTLNTWDQSKRKLWLRLRIEEASAYHIGAFLSQRITRWKLSPTDDFADLVYDVKTDRNRSVNVGEEIWDDLKGCLGNSFGEDELYGEVQELAGRLAEANRDGEAAEDCIPKIYDELARFLFATWESVEALAAILAQPFEATIELRRFMPNLCGARFHCPPR
jgi:hypothetical protein